MAQTLRAKSTLLKKDDGTRNKHCRFLLYAAAEPLYKIWSRKYLIHIQDEN